MANQLKMAKINAILTLHERGWSQRKIAKQLGIDRGTVARHISASSQAAKAPTDSGGQNQPKAPTGSSDSNAAKAPTGSDGSRSDCEAYRKRIVEMLEKDLSAKRIHQDLAEEGFAGSYYSVRRFVRTLQQQRPLPFRRIETPAGQEAQIDFGTGNRIVQPDGRKRKTHVFRIVLSHSRKAYSESVYRQTTENFIRCIENAFWHFGGVPRTLVPDNLRAAVKKADWFDPELNPKIESFCRHYGVAMLPTRPRTPRHKGKVEKGVDYVQENALKGHEFDSLQQQNDHLLHWEQTVADTRIHGTTKQQVAQLFRQVEKAALQPLPSERFSFFHEGQRSVHRDAHVEVDKSYYSVPPEYVTRRVWVRWDSRLVRIFNNRWEQICVHAKQEPGRFSTRSEHLAREKIGGVERGVEWSLRRAASIGPHSEQWAAALVKRRGSQGLRTLQGLLGLVKKHSSAEIEQACEIAHSYGAYHLRNIRRLLKHHAQRQPTLEFTEDHPMIRDIGVYGDLVRSAFHNQQQRLSR